MEQLPDKIKKDMAMDRIGRKLCKFLEEYYDKRVIEFRVAMQSPDHFIIHPMNIDGKTLDVKWDFKNATYGNEVFGYINKGDKHNESIEESEQDELWNNIVARIAAADLMAKVTPGDNEALSKWKKKAIDILSKQYHLIKQ